VLPERLVPPDHKVHKAIKELKAIKAIKDRKVHKATKATKAQMAQLAPMVLLELLVLPARLDQLGPPLLQALPLAPIYIGAFQEAHING
jgi:hypothetical protein